MVRSTVYHFAILTIENLYSVHGHGQSWCFLVKFRGKILG